MQEGGELRQSFKPVNNKHISNTDGNSNIDRLISNFSINFINLNPENLDLEIQQSLGQASEFIGVDRCYMGVFYQRDLNDYKRFQWTAPGIEFHLNHTSTTPVNTLPWWDQTNSQFNLMHIPNLDELPPNPVTTKETMQVTGVKSMLVLPLNFDQKLTGYLQFEAIESPKTWTEDEIASLQTFASILTHVIDQVNSQNELMVRERYFQKLNEISLSFLNAQTNQEMLDVVVNQMKYIIMADGCFIALWDETTRKVTPAAASEPFSEEYKKLKVQPDEKSITEQVVHSEDILIIHDIAKSPFSSRRIAHAFASNCLLGIPLIVKDQKLGSIILGFEETHFFTQEEIALAKQAANLVSLALSKQMALQEAKKHAQEVEILRNSAMIVASTLEPEMAVSLILEQLEQVVPFDYASIQMLSDNYLEVIAVNGQHIPANMLGQRFFIPGDNPNTLVIQTLMPYSYANVQEEFIPFRAPKFAHIHSWLGVPLIVHEQIIGMIALEKSDINFYNTDHIKLASAFADQVSISLYNAQLYQDEQLRARELDALRDTLFDVTNELDLSQLLPAILKRAVALLNAEAGELALYDSEKDVLNVVISQSVGKDISGAVLSVGEGLFGRVAESGQPLIVPDYMQWDEHLEFYNGGVVHSVLASPLIVGKKLMGVIGIARTNSTEVFTEKDQNLLLLFAQQAAIAIKNAELFNEVQTLTKIDELTGAYNRRGFNELCYRELLRAKRSNQPQSMLMIDLDFFKKINDQYGHPIGDQMLIMLCHELKDHLRETDIMCRFGGEEFAVLLPDTDLQTALSISERLRMKIDEKPFIVPEMILHITISIGISWMPGDQAELYQLLDQADEAMYEAKRSGRNQVCVYKENCK